MPFKLKTPVPFSPLFPPGLDRDAWVAEFPYLNLVAQDGVFYEADGNEYTWISSDVDNATGITAKGPNGNSASFFEQHIFLEFTNTAGETTWYDPSYGVTYDGPNADARKVDFLNKAIAGYFRGATGQVRESVVQADLNGDGDMLDTEFANIYLIRERGAADPDDLQFSFGDM